MKESKKGFNLAEIRQIKAGGHAFDPSEIKQIKNAKTQDAVELCDYVSRQFGVELTLAQAAGMMKCLGL